MIRARILALAQHYDLPRDAAAQFERVLALLATEPAAVTAVRDPQDAVERHVADSLSALQVEEVRRAATIADIGSGGGFPGLALAVARPEARLWLIESVGRKCAFLERAVAAAGLQNVEVVCARAEEWAQGLGRLDVVTARALGSLPTLVEYAAPLLRVGGALVAWKSEPEPEEDAAGRAAAEALGMEPGGYVQVPPSPGASRRRLYVYRKVAATPAGFPRRSGMARKRPLSAPGQRSH